MWRRRLTLWSRCSWCGGPRKPVVAEFCAVELGARIQLGSWSARLCLANALDVRHRLPRIWGRVLAREARVPLARLVAAKSRHLSWDGEGPVTGRFVHDHLRPLHSYVIQPVTDLADQAPVDAYEIPDRHRRAVRRRTPADCSPFSSHLADDRPGEMDVDHTQEYDDAALSTGPEKHWSSLLGNYGPRGRFNHRLRTHRQWTARQPFNELQLWRDPHGQVYLVDHTGTHKVTRAGNPAGAATGYDPDVDVSALGDVIEIDSRGRG